MCWFFHRGKCLVSEMRFSKREVFVWRVPLLQQVCSDVWPFLPANDHPSQYSSLCWSLFLFWIEIKPSVDLTLVVFLLQVFLSLFFPLVFVYNFGSSVMFYFSLFPSNISCIFVCKTVAWSPASEASISLQLFLLSFCSLVKLTVDDGWRTFSFFIKVAWQNRGTEISERKFYHFLVWYS